MQIQFIFSADISFQFSCNCDLAAGFSGFSDPAQKHPQLIMGIGGIRIKQDGFVERLLCLLIFLLPQQDGSQGDVARSMFRISPDELAEEMDCLGVLSLSFIDQSQIVTCRKLMRLKRNALFHQRLRLWVTGLKITDGACSIVQNRISRMLLEELT